MSDALTQSDWDLIQKTTGLTRGDGHLVTFTDAGGNEVDSGAAYEQAGAMVFAMADMRIYAAQFGTTGDLFAGTGDITPEQLEQYFAKYQSSAVSGTGPYSSTVLQDLKKLSIFVNKPSVSFQWYYISCNEGAPYVTKSIMTHTLIGYARCSTDKQDLTAQKDALRKLGVGADRIYTDHGFTGTKRARP